MNKRKGFWSYIKAKGFYIALALCITGAAVAAWYTAADTIQSINEANSSTIQEITSHAQEENQWTAKPESQISKPSSSSAASSSQSSASSSSSPASSKPAASVVSPKPAAVQSAAPARSACVYSSPLPGGAVVGAFSNGELVKNYTLNVWRTHDAVDIAAEKGTEVMAVCDGTVDTILSDPLWGGVVRLLHADGNISVYCGLAVAEKLAEGESVAAGQVIGTVDSIASEISMEPHLHFQIISAGSAIDPGTLIAELATQ